MAHFTPLFVVLASMDISLTTGLTTCPGFPGFCSESFPGQSCNVVCDLGRNNVPLCQEDGTWTDIPRCIEHDPGVEEQVPGLCPSIPGYCAQSFLNSRCKFDCVTGADIDSLCTQDGTWAPYPTCAGDLRETKDGCDGCPGPAGGARNRTAEAVISRNTVSDRRVPKVIGSNGGRKTIPSFAGNINIGRLNPAEKPSTQNRFSKSRPAQRVTPAPTQPPAARRNIPTRRPQQQFVNNQNFQTNFNQRNQRPQQPQRQPQRQFPQQTRRQPQQQFVQKQPQQQQSFKQGLNTFRPGSEASQPLSLFDQIKNKINQGNSQEAKQTRQQPRQQQEQQPQSFQQPQQSVQQQQPPRRQNENEQSSLSPTQQRLRDQILKQRQQQAQGIANILNTDTVESTPPQQTFRQQPQQNFQAQPSCASSFGVFEEVNLAGFGGPNPSPNLPPARQAPRPQRQEDGFFGVFPEVNLQG